MISKTLARRLERLEGSLMSTGGPRLMEIRVISLATGEVIKRILTQQVNVFVGFPTTSLCSMASANAALR